MYIPSFEKVAEDIELMISEKKCFFAGSIKISNFVAHFSKREF